MTSDYLPWARVLSESFLEHNPGAAFTVLVLDEPEPRPAARHRPLPTGQPAGRRDRPGHVPVDGHDLRRLRALVRAEAVAAAPPAPRRRRGAVPGLRHPGLRLARDTSPAARARAASSSRPTGSSRRPPTGLQPDEDAFLRLGQFNGGFLAVGPGARRVPGLVGAAPRSRLRAPQRSQTRFASSTSAGST